MKDFEKNKTKKKNEFYPTVTNSFEKNQNKNKSFRILVQKICLA